jgi:squalene-hopene/tetraprenyl-beta-curcumene cyclase
MTTHRIPNRLKVTRRSRRAARLVMVTCVLATLALLVASPTFLLAADKAATGKAAPPTSWDPHAAARYLDDREIYWQSWEHARKDHGTLCVSCHTQATYGLARPALRHTLGEQTISAPEQAMLASIRKRVQLWDQMAPFYDDATSGAPLGQLSPLTRTAFDHAWALQSTSGPTQGAWVWQNFHYSPWEAPESEYHNAALMAVAVAKAPDHYRDDPGVAPHRDALIRYLTAHFEAQPLLNKMVALWASHWYPGLLTQDQQAQVVADLASRQRSDGGWSLADMGQFHRVDGSPLETRPDGYATGLAVLVLYEAAFPDSSHARRQATAECIARGGRWLIANQNQATGAWEAWSLNKKRDPASNIGKFMSDAATSYAVLALEEIDQDPLKSLAVNTH